MRRGSLVILASVLLMMAVLVVLLFYVMPRLTAPGDSAGNVTVVPATVPSPQVQSPVEPTGVVERLVFILSVLFVFVSALLVLVRLLGKVPFKD